LTSLDEYLDLNMDGHCPADPVPELVRSAPPGLNVLEARPIFSRVESLGAAVSAARYRLLSRGLSDADMAAALARLPATPAVRDLAVGTASGAPPYDPVGIEIILSLTPGTRLFPVLARLFNCAEENVRRWRIARVACYQDRDGSLVSLMEGL
jgi:hypothetical protein